MKKLFSYIFIAGLLFPVFGYVSAASTPIVPPPAPVVTPAQKTIANLKDIYNRLTVLSNQTQLTVGQIEATGGSGTQATIDLVDANAALAKGKSIMDKLTPDMASDAFKNSVNDTENYFKEGRDDILTTLDDLKATLPAINTANQ